MTELYRTLQEEDVEVVDPELEAANAAKFTENFKIIMTVVMFLEVFIGLIPAKCEACRKSVYVLSFLNCFSAGIFISIALVHVIPDTNEGFMEWAHENGYSEAFPLPTFMAMLGYCMILLIDKVLARAYKVSDEETVHIEHCDDDKCKGEGCADDTKIDNKVNVVPDITDSSNVQDSKMDLVTETNVEEVARDKDVVEDETIRVSKDAVSKTSGVVLCLALGVHAFFEGISFGMLPNADAAAQLAVGIFIHKGSSVISLGGALSRSGYSFKAVFGFLMIFAICAPIGIIIGMNIAGASAIVITIFMGISAGTFLYVATSEIIVNEFDRGKHQGWKFFMVIAGATLITCIWLLEGEEEE